MVLTVTLKNDSQDPNRFRQLEQWANQYVWHTIPVAAGWTANIGPMYMTDPLGFVHLHGQATYTGAPADNTLMLTLPQLNPSIRPRTRWRFDSAALLQFCFVDINTDGTVRFRTTGPSGANPQLDFIYDPRV